MVNWRTELTSNIASLGKLNISGGIFQGDSLSPLIFVICMVPLSKVLRNVKVGYLLRDVKNQSPVFINDLKIFARNKTEIHSLESTVEVINHDALIQSKEMLYYNLEAKETSRK